MERNFVLVPAEMRLDAFLRQPEHRDGIRHIIIIHSDSLSPTATLSLQALEAPGERGGPRSSSPYPPLPDTKDTIGGRCSQDPVASQDPVSRRPGWTPQHT